MIQALQKARELGVEFTVINKQLRIRFKQGSVDNKLLERLKAEKDRIIAHLISVQSLRHYSIVETPYGRGTVWEIYPWLQRIGVLIEGCEMPRFFYFEDISIPIANKESKQCQQ